MICFHSLIYWYLLQRKVTTDLFKSCCDLLSFFDLLIFVTTVIVAAIRPCMLWFAFILWSTDICYNLAHHHTIPGRVVICFHSLIYWYLLQLWCGGRWTLVSCDLLSFFDLLIFVTTIRFTTLWFGLLWFAFILWSTDICYNLLKRK